MPFSTYLRDAAPTDSEARSSSAQSQELRGHYPPAQYPGYAMYSDTDTMRHYPIYQGTSRSALAPAPAPGAPSASPLNVHSSNNDVSVCVSAPSSVSTASASNNSNHSKSYIPPSPSPSSSMHRPATGNENGSDSLFQMPSFLMGNFGGTLAPGGGAEVLTPSALGMLDFVSSPYTLGQDTGCRNGKPLWQTTKYYILEEYQQEHSQNNSDEPAQRKNDVVSVAETPHTTPARHPSTSIPAHNANASGPLAAASPFGYLNAESPRQQQQQQQQQQASGNDDTAAQIISPVEQQRPTSAAMPQTPASFQPPPELYAPVPTSGLPVYSQSGFDMLSILARVARRTHQTISLGPVDLTCAFVVADVRRADAPIVYASRTFCELTGYSEAEVLGRNCRFLQAPGGRVARSDVRRFTSPDAVRELRFALDKDREVQVSLINYRKDGRPFVNRVSVVPIPAEDGASEIAFHVGFQVDLNEQPGLIARRIQDGRFYSAGAYGDSLYKSQTPAERSARGMGKKLRALLSDPTFQKAVPLATSCNSLPSSNTAAATNPNPNPTTSSPAPPSSSSRPAPTGKPDTRDERQWLNLLLLEHMPDFLHVLSLKGHFLYVSPGITRVLGYAPADLVGKSVGDFCHPSDAVPLLRELKESTGQATASNEGPGAGAGAGNGSSPAGAANETIEAQHTSGQRAVDLLFRMRTKSGGYAWIESIGRLHIEAGKGRKAIVLSGRMCAMPNLRWGVIEQAGGLLSPWSSADPNEGFVESGEIGQSSNGSNAEREFWAMLCEDGLFLVAGAGVRDLLGWGTAEMIGRSIREFIVGDPSTSSPNPSSSAASASSAQILNALALAYAGSQTTRTQTLACQMKKRNGESVWMQLTLYANESRTVSGRVIAQFKLVSPPSATSASTSSSFQQHRQQQAYSPTTFLSPTYAFSFSAPSQSVSTYPYAHFHPDRAPIGSVGIAIGKMLHAPSTNVFAEFETHRGTSWQYELQQLKYANDKLREEVNVLEARQRARQQQQQSESQQPLQQQQQVVPSSVWVGNVQA